MSAAISHLPDRLPSSTALPAYRTNVGRVRHWLQVLGPGRLALLFLILLLLWSFIGSLAMDIRTPATSHPRIARLWLGGTMVIALMGMTGGLLAGSDPGE